MTRKPIEFQDRRNKKKKSPVSSRKHNDKKHSIEKRQNVSIDSMNNKDKKKSRKSLFSLRRLVSLSIITYLAYYVTLGCGSPFEYNITSKPAICEPIDSLKLDIYTIFDSDFAKANINPYTIDPVMQNYQRYAPFIHEKSQPILQAVSVSVDKSKQVYGRTVAPAVNKWMSSPFIKDKQEYLQQLYTTSYETAKTNYEKTQTAINAKYRQLPQPVLRRVDQLKDLYVKLDHVDLVPIMINAYWRAVDIYRDQFVPFVFDNQYSQQIKLWLNQQNRSQAHYNHYIEPYRAQINNRLHQLYDHVSGISLPWTGKKQEEDKIYNAVKEKLHQENPRLKQHAMLSKAMESVKSQMKKVTDGELENKIEKMLHDTLNPSTTPLEKMKQVEEQAILL